MAEERGGGDGVTENRNPSQLVKAEQPANAIVPVKQLPEWMGLHSVASVSNFDMTTDAGIRALTKFSGECDYEIAKLADKEIEVESFYLAPYEKLDVRTGELIPLVFVGLLDANGKTYSSSSKGMRKSVIQLAQFFGWEPWKPPLVCKVNIVKATVGEWHSLEYVRRLPAATAKKGK